MNPHATAFSAPDLASSYVANFESALKWCGGYPLSNKKTVATFIAGVHPRSIRDFLLNEDHLKSYTSVIVAFLSEYTVLCGAVTRMGTLAVAHSHGRSDETIISSTTKHNAGNNNNFRNRGSHTSRDTVSSSSVPHERTALVVKILLIRVSLLVMDLVTPLAAVTSSVITARSRDTSPRIAAPAWPLKRLLPRNPVATSRSPSQPRRPRTHNVTVVPAAALLDQRRTVAITR